MNGKNCGKGGKHSKTVKGKYAEGGKVKSYAQPVPGSGGAQQYTRRSEDMDGTPEEKGSRRAQNFIRSMDVARGDKQRDLVMRASDTEAQDRFRPSAGSGRPKARPKPKGGK